MDMSIITNGASDINQLTLFFFGLFILTMILFLFRIEENIKLREENERLKDPYGYSQKERAEIELAIKEIEDYNETLNEALRNVQSLKRELLMEQDSNLIELKGGKTINGKLKRRSTGI